MYVGGDASTRFLAFHQNESMALLKDSSPFPDQPKNKPWRGRNNYHSYGVLRTKPGRSDSPLTLSMSCSDKIASWNVLGIQGGLTVRIFNPVYISSIIIGDVDEDIRRILREDCERAFCRRIEDLQGIFQDQRLVLLTNDQRFLGLPESYCVTRPALQFTSLEFPHSRSSLSKLCTVSGSSNDCGRIILLDYYIA
jgi:tRNA-specific adenosine deaminase 1